MELDAVIKDIPQLMADPVCVAYRASFKDDPEVRWVNQAFCDTFGRSFEDAVGLKTYDLFHWDYVADFQSSIREMNLGGQTKLSHDTLCLRRDNSSFWASLSFVALSDDEGDGRHGIFVIKEIDELKNREQSAELALIEHEQLLEKVEAAQTRLVSSIEMIPDPFAIYDASDRLVIWNPAFAERTTGSADLLRKGMKKSDILRISIEKGYIADAIGREEDWLEEHLADWREGGTSNTLLKLRGRDYKTIRSEAPNGDRVLLRIDISEQLRQKDELESYARKLEQANNEISHQALHDDLTGLGNRRFLTIKLDELIAERDRTGGELVALHVDLDRFKQINDTMGHSAGDHVLRAVADILRKFLRQDDVIARTGGDEFVVLFRTRQGSADPEVLADRLIDEISKPIPFEDRLCRLGASIGIAKTPVIEAADLVTSSDVALYKAKQGGRSMHAVFDHVDLENLRQMKRLSDDVLRGIEEEEFIPHYQVQIDPRKNSVVCLEVLARWNHPQRGLLAPDAFLDVAADMQLLGKIDGLIFRGALEECQTPFADLANPPALAFNISQQRFNDPRLEKDLGEMHFPFPIAFEMVETEFFEQGVDECLRRIEMLRQMGITIEVDDFGSGSSSIVGLRQIGASRLKIDHRLVQPITTSQSARKLVESMIDIGRALGIAVTAEGIETAAHAEILTELGCDRLQGYHFARPMPLPEVMQFVETCESPNPTIRTGTND